MATLGTSFAFFILCICCWANTCFKNWGKRLISTKVYSRFLQSHCFSFVLFTSSHTIVLLFFLLFYGTTLQISFFLLPFSFLEPCISSIALQQPVFCSIRDGYIIFKNIINVMLSWTCSFDIMFPSISSPILPLLFQSPYYNTPISFLLY